MTRDEAMAAEAKDSQDPLDELEWRRQHAALHGEWDEAARYAALLAARTPTVPDHAAPVGRACPTGYPIKARHATRRYHLPGQSWYTL